MTWRVNMYLGKELIEQWEKRVTLFEKKIENCDKML